MTWGGKQNDAKDAFDQLSYAFDRGVNWFDTAEIYAIPPSKETSGNTDRCIAPWLAKQDRTKVIVATKVAGFGNDYLRKGKRMRKKRLFFFLSLSLFLSYALNSFPLFPLTFSSSSESFFL